MRTGIFLLTASLVFGFYFYTENQAGKVVANPEKLIQTEAPIVLELFTSQSCSSCPPADKILVGLSENKNIIALGCHVTYWDHLSWKDTLGHKFCTQRQRAYAAASNSRRVFTPELRVNGVASMVGSKNSAIQEALQVHQGKLKEVKISRNENGDFEVRLPEIEREGILSVNLVTYLPNHVEKMRSGENKGKEVHYANPVNAIKPLLENWDGKLQKIQVSKGGLAQNIKGFAVLIQKNTHQGVGEILAAGTVEF